MFKKNLWPILILIVVGAAVYFFNLQNPLFWDDDDWIINNSSVHNITLDNVKFWFTHNTLAGVGLKSNYYRPFLFFTFALNWVMTGIKPLVWHLTSNLIHVVNGVLVFSILYLVSRKRLVAFFAALIFLIHPLQTEAVTYISGRGDLLVAFFMLLALLLVLLRSLTMFGSSTSKHRDSAGSLRGSTSKEPEVEPLRLRIATPQYYWPLSIGLLVLALLSRETAIIFPFLAMLMLMALSQDKFFTSLKKSFIKIIPFFVVVAVYGILRLTVLNFQNTLNFYPQANIYSESLMVRLYTFGGVLVEYIKLLFVPVGLHMDRSSVVYTSLAQWPVWEVFLILVGLITFLVYLYRKERASRPKLTNSNLQITNNHQIQNSKQSPNQKFENSLKIENPAPETSFRCGTSPAPSSALVLGWKFSEISDFRMWFFGVAWFFIGLAPVSGITPINAVMYEHWLYLPMIGFWFILAFYIDKMFAFFKENKKFLFVICVLLFGAYISFFAVQSIKRNVLWGKPIEFYQDILKYEPQSTRINNNLGNLYFNQQDLPKAKEYYEKAAEGDSDFAQPHFNLGSVLESEGDVFGAIKEYEKAIEIDSYFYYAHQNLVALYANRGDLDRAIEYVEILKKIKPQDPRVFYNAALIYAARNNKAAAINDLNAGLLVAGSDLYAKELIKELLVKLNQ